MELVIIHIIACLIGYFIGKILAHLAVYGMKRFIIFILIIYVSLFTGYQVYAQESNIEAVEDVNESEENDTTDTVATSEPDETPSLDNEHDDIESHSESSGDDDRLNALEIRLQDYEYTIDQLKESIQLLQDNADAEYQEKLAIQQQVDVLIVGLDELLNQYIAECENNILLEEQRTAQFDALLLQLETMELSITDQLTEVKEISVSGNELITNMNDNLGDGIKQSTEEMLTELNTTLGTTNKFVSYLAVLLVILLVVFIAVFIGKLLINTIFKHI